MPAGKSESVRQRLLAGVAEGRRAAAQKGVVGRRRRELTSSD